MIALSLLSLLDGRSPSVTILKSQQPRLQARSTKNFFLLSEVRKKFSFFFFSPTTPTKKTMSDDALSSSHLTGSGMTPSSNAASVVAAAPAGLSTVAPKAAPVVQTPPARTSAPPHSVPPPSVVSNKYPAFKESSFMTYTNRQIRHYLRSGALNHLTPERIEELTAARDRTIKACKWDGNSSDFGGDKGEKSNAAPSFVNASLRGEGGNPITIPGSPSPCAPTPFKTTSITVPAQERTYDDDGEPDITIPPYPSDMRGSRIGKITTLKTGGGLASHSNWANDLNLAFGANPSSYGTTQQRVALAASCMDENLKTLFATASAAHPALYSHWNKFSRWVRTVQLEGEASRLRATQALANARQEPTEPPRQFYNRLVTLAGQVGVTIAANDYWPKLTTGLQTMMIRQNVISQAKHVYDLVENAERLWSTFSHKRKQDEDHQGSGKKSRSSKSWRPGGPKSQDTGKQEKPSWSQVPDAEKQCRRDSNSCFNCGLAGHQAKDCQKLFNSGKPALRGKTQQKKSDGSTTYKKQSANQLRTDTDSSEKK